MANRKYLTRIIIYQSKKWICKEKRYIDIMGENFYRERALTIK